MEQGVCIWFSRLTWFLLWCWCIFLSSFLIVRRILWGWNGSGGKCCIWLASCCVVDMRGSHSFFGDHVVGRLGIAGPSWIVRTQLIHFTWVFSSQKWWKDHLTDMTWWCCRKWCAKTRKAKIKQSPRTQILWVCLFFFLFITKFLIRFSIHLEEYFWADCECSILLDIIMFPNADINISLFPGWVLLSSTWVSHSLESWSLLLFAAAADMFIILWMGSIEQVEKVSLPFLGSICFRLFVALFHTSPDGFFWAGRESPILLYRYVFAYSQQLLMCIFHNSLDGFFWAGCEFAILLDRYVFRLFAAAADVYIS